MELSAQREAELMEEAMPKIYRAVDNFTARCLKAVVKVPYDDFVQECAIAYLEYIRAASKEEQLAVFPWFDMMQAMSKLVLSYQPMSCPKRTNHFNEVLRNMPKTVSYETSLACAGDIDGMAKNWVEDVEAMMDLWKFAESMPDYAERILSMRLWGMTSRQIAGQLGVGEAAISRRLKRYLEKYKDFIKEEDEDE